MTKPEAIIHIKKTQPIFNDDDIIDGCDDNLIDEQLCEAIGIAIECIEKQIPKKPNWQGDMMCMDSYCPNCGAYLDDGENPCEECHQLIDWSDNK